ncbi:hypothetical protein FOL46_000244 [Perkinsus olseni]|uniref:Protein kinase domain-containing protein n=1 Tax=Perkinsus olseni TaxID=32597 RepID=A0A7J6MJ38_PEROL|nr:hypothetical protein FOL46_000244 [Perkinsus olseni]
MRPSPPAPTDANLNFISLEYPYEELRRATNNFSQDNVLGTGTYGCVYRGQLKDGTEVAVKVLQAPKESGFKEEVKVLSKFRHANLVILMGFARNEHERCLVYELLSGGDVSSRLQPSSGPPSFNWYQRLSVALDAALGLSHLHNATPRVFHRDIKTQNILLDRNGSAKVADFGLACLAEHRSLGHFKVQQCSGTIGYADPAYINTSVVTEKTEVYSFGMVLIELLTARPPAVQDPSTGQILHNFQNVQVDDSARIANQLDPRAQWPHHPAITGALIMLALRCVDQREPISSSRPRFVDIVAELRHIARQAEQVQGGAAMSTPPSAAHRPSSTRSPTPVAVDAQQPEARRSNSVHRQRQPQDPGVVVYRREAPGERRAGYVQPPRAFAGQSLSPQSHASSTPVQQHNRVSPASSFQHGDSGESGVRVIRSVHPHQSASDKSVNDSVSYHRMEHVTIRPRQSPAAQTRAPVGIPDQSLENSAFQFNHMITGYDRSSIQNQTIQATMSPLFAALKKQLFDVVLAVFGWNARLLCDESGDNLRDACFVQLEYDLVCLLQLSSFQEEGYSNSSVEMDPDLAAAVALSKLESRNSNRFYDEEPISIESLNRLTDRDNRAKIEQVCREFGWPHDQVAQAFRVRGTVDAAVEYILEKASTSDSVIDRAHQAACERR